MSNGWSGGAKPSEPARNGAVKRARFETSNSWREWAVRVGVWALSEDHPDRRIELARWGRWFYRNGPTASSEIAENDPVRDGPPKGWRGVV